VKFQTRNWKSMEMQPVVSQISGNFWSLSASRCCYYMYIAF